MNLNSLSLQNFRNYKKQVFSFSDNIGLIVGKNGSGKTNILEAIYLLATGRSFRATKEQQMILYGEEIGRVIGLVEGVSLEIVLTTGEVGGQRAPSKKYVINGLGKRKMDFVGQVRAVLFRPEDIELVLGSPAERRHYLNDVLEQVDREYRRSSLAYQKGLRQRNKLLERIREREAERKQLLFWDQILLRNGEVIFKKRQEFIEFINQKLQGKTSELQLNYDFSAISPARLRQYADREVGAASTLVGPHRDDFEFILKRRGKLKKDLAIYGSRGEQRMAILAVKLNELEFIEEVTKDKPLLLLDDIFSELDEENRDVVLKLLDKHQTIITTTDEKLVPAKFKKKVEIMRLR